MRIMAKLRDPVAGCPWDVEQTFASIAPYTIEEAYEVADAIQQGDMAALKDELGDLLLQVVFHSRMAEEIGAFDFAAVAEAIADKMTRRHPHVFGDTKVAGAAAQTVAGEQHQAKERTVRAAAAGLSASALDGVNLALPALVRADKLQARAARVGFDWPKAEQVLDKIEEEVGELRREMTADVDRVRIQDEIGDLLFATVNLARHLGIDAEAALRTGNAKFERRFRGVEAALARQGRSAERATLDELESLWQAEKARVDE
jgi:MazG family protein